jgi:NADPH-ferrihemoprotein reductase
MQTELNKLPYFTSIEEDFITWKELLWTNVCEQFNLLVSGEDISLRQYELKVHEKDELKTDEVFKGEIVRLNSYMNQKT